MSENPTFLGKTIPSIIRKFADEQLSPPEQKIKLNHILKKADEYILQFRSSIREEYRLMASAANLNPDEYLEEMRIREKLDIARINIETYVSTNKDTTVNTRLESILPDVSLKITRSGSLKLVRETLSTLESQLEYHIKDTAISESLRDTLKAILSSINEPIIDEMLIWQASLKINAGKLDQHRDAIDRLKAKLENVTNFVAQAKAQVEEISKLAELFDQDGNVNNPNMINWIGYETDCSILIRFLMKNGYIEKTNQVNKYIARHFLFNGVEKTSESIRGLHTEQSGDIKLKNSGLIIPSKL